MTAASRSLRVAPSMPSGSGGPYGHATTSSYGALPTIDRKPACSAAWWPEHRSVRFHRSLGPLRACSMMW
jgi:hypothetical protein